MRLGREYEDANLPLAVKRLSQAGMRLSEVLNDCLSPEEKKAIPAPHFRKEQQPAPALRNTPGRILPGSRRLARAGQLWAHREGARRGWRAAGREFSCG